MSLYNNAPPARFSSSIESGIDGLFAGLGGQVTELLGGGRLAQAATGAAASAASQAAKNAINKSLPPGMRGKIDTAAGVIGSAMDGDWEGALMGALSGGLFDGILGNLSGFAAQERLRGQATPMLNGVSLVEAQRIHDEMIAAKHVRKNVFFLEISSDSEGDLSEVFNLLCVDVEYNPFQVRANKEMLGGAVQDVVQGQDAVEMRFVTYDNANGDVKRFFARHHAMVAAQDGTVGLPAEFALRIKIVDGVVGGGSIISSMSNGGYTDEGLFRVTSLEKSLSRREAALQELQLSFSQLDTFINA